MHFARGSCDHRLYLISAVRLRFALATSGLPSKPHSAVYVRVVLQELLRRADMYGVCWPSTERLAIDCEIARSTVCVALGHLVELGVVERRSARNAEASPKRRSTRYRLNWDRLDELAGAVSSDSTRSDREARKRGEEAPVVRARKRPQYGRASARSTGRNLKEERSPLPPNDAPPLPIARPTDVPSAERSARVTFAEAMREFSQADPVRFAAVAANIPAAARLVGSSPCPSPNDSPPAATLPASPLDTTRTDSTPKPCGTDLAGSG